MVAGFPWRTSWPFKKGPWGAEEDALLLEFVKEYGASSWHTAHLLYPELNRSGKSCRLRYLNQLSPRIHRTSITPQEEHVILLAYSMLGNQWSRIAALLPGRTDNTVKNVVNMWLKRARRRRAVDINSVLRAAQLLHVRREQRVRAPGHSAIDDLPSDEANNLILLPTSACGLSVMPQPPAATTQMGMYGTWGAPASSPRTYTALGASGGAGARMMNDSPADVGAGMMSTITMPTFSPMLVTESKIVEPCNEEAPTGTSTYGNEWPAMQVPPAVQASQERPNSCTLRLPSVQKPSESSALQLISVQELFHKSSKLPSVQNASSYVSLQLPSIQDPLQSLEGSELPSVQPEPFQSFLLGSEQLPSLLDLAVPRQQTDIVKANRPICRNHTVNGNNDLLEAIKLSGLYGSSLPGSSSSARRYPPAASSCSEPGLLCDLSYLASSLRQAGLKDKEEEEAESLQQLLNATEENGDKEKIGSLMNMDVMSVELINITNNMMWNSMPGACHSVGESSGTKAFNP